MPWRYFVPMALLVGGLLVLAALVRVRGCSPSQSGTPRMPTAEQQFTRVAQPLHARAHGLRGTKREKAFLEAVAAYQAVIDRFPNDRTWCADALFNMGRCYQSIGGFERAETIYRRVGKEYMDQAWSAAMATKALGDLLRDTARPRSARAAYLRCVAKYKDIADPAVKALVEECRSQANRLSSAREDLVLQPD